jgi:hypothetical protein
MLLRSQKILMNLKFLKFRLSLLNLKYLLNQNYLMFLRLKILLNSQHYHLYHWNL